jgi:NADPH-dependent glutamate synthase beta subunit-like oxidoreductase/NAD(P)H-flavin reductase
MITHQHTTHTLKLNYNLNLADLYTYIGLQRLDAHFLNWLDIEPALKAQLLQLRDDKPKHSKDVAKILLDLAPHVEDFIADVFNIQAEINALRQSHHDLAALYSVKRLFVQRKSTAKYGKNKESVEHINGIDVHKKLNVILSNAVYVDMYQKIQFSPSAFNLPANFALENAHINMDYVKQYNAILHFELCLAYAIQYWEATEESQIQYEQELDIAMQYCAWALQEYSSNIYYTGILFKQAQKLDVQNLLHHIDKHTAAETQIQKIDIQYLRQRSNNERAPFSLTDKGHDLLFGLDEANYCIHCHNQNKDSCSKGLHEKTSTPEQIEYKKSPFGVKLAGCPLEEKISEFHLAKTQGLAVAALAIICIDNPMAAATGHRICNDCMKACIYQKQTPVDIPQAETQTLKSVLNLPWGFEIYSLLTRWNPLNIDRPLPHAPSHKKVLVVGMGPAGYTLAHHLMNDGHTVVGIDGLKIEPLDERLCGKNNLGQAVEFEPIYNLETLLEDLDARTPAGFGGVAEYGITVRWDKNFLKIIRLLLERRQQFALFGGVRFGSTITTEIAWSMGFEHIALAMGAGKPTILNIPNGLAKGVRTASDFLMGLQLSGAAKLDSIANMQIRLPIVVIGGGLTAIDTATESMAYYVRQVEKFAQRYHALIADPQYGSEQNLRINWTPEECNIADEFLAHAKAIQQEREAAKHENREAKIAQLIQTWGGVTVAYRKRLIDSPAYTLNHEEVQKALEEGIYFAECLNPKRIDIDTQANSSGNCSSISFEQKNAQNEQQIITLAAKSIFIAAGTQPNTVLAREDSSTFILDGKYFQAIDENGQKVQPEYATSKTKEAHVLLHKTNDQRFISFFGDLHPSYFGNVVKAMGSAKQGYPMVSKVLQKSQAKNSVSEQVFMDELNHKLRAHVHDIIRLTPNIIEVIIHAPLAAQQFQPGQFYRLQNFDAYAKNSQYHNQSTLLAMEGLALTGAWVDKEKGLISCITLEMGGSSNLCADLKKGEAVVLMGPTGAPTHIQSNETVMLVGGGLGNAVLFSIGAAFRAAGSKVLYFAGYKKLIDRYKIEDIEAAADTIIWCSDEADMHKQGFAINAGRPQDKSFVGNIVEAIQAYASGALGDISIQTFDVKRIIAIGSDRMMAAVALARHGVLKPYLNTNHLAIGSINSPMQCMMKEICAQCLQPHTLPDGSVEYVFSCFNQDQELDRVDFNALNTRLGQNSLQEKLSKGWIDACRKAN